MKLKKLIKEINSAETELCVKKATLVLEAIKHYDFVKQVERLELSRLLESDEVEECEGCDYCEGKDFEDDDLDSLLVDFGNFLINKKLEAIKLVNEEFYTKLLTIYPNFEFVDDADLANFEDSI